MDTQSFKRMFAAVNRIQSCGRISRWPLSTILWLPTRRVQASEISEDCSSMRMAIGRRESIGLTAAAAENRTSH